jgi:3-oxoacyl-[acyl-carrier-protein] synthase-3
VTLRLLPLPGLRIAATGASGPEHVPAELRDLDNDAACRALFGADWRSELQRRGWTPEHLLARWGVERRCWCSQPGAEPPDGAPDAGDLALAAARAALDEAGLRGRDLDVLIVSTSTPPRATSSLSGRVSKALAHGGASFDVRAGGAGALHAWLTATSLLAQGARRALVVAVETPSRWLDARAPVLALLYGDGAGAVLLERDERAEGGLLGAVMLARGASGKPMTVPGALPPTPREVLAGAFRMTLPDAAYLEALAGARRELLGAMREAWPAEVAGARRFLPAAATAEQAGQDAETAGLPAERLVTSLRAHGALGTAAAPVALHDLRAAGGARAGETLLLSAVGGGLSGAALLWRC